MAEGEGEELPPVVAALVGDDSDFFEMIARDVEAATQFKADLQAALGEGVEVAGPTMGAGDGTEAIVEETQAAVTEAQDIVSEASAEIAESLAEAGVQGGDGLAEAVVSSAAVAAARVDELMAQMRALMQEGTEEAQAAAAALQPEIDAATAAWQKAEREGFGYGETVEQTATTTTAAAAEIVTATTAVAASTETATAAAESFEESFDAAYAAVASGSISADAAMRALAGTGDDSVTRVTGALAKMRSSWLEAQAAMEAAGTSEATLAVNAALLTDAQGQLTDANTSLVLSFQQLSAGADVSYDELAGVLGTVADAQALVTDLTQAQVEAMTQLNLAAIQGTAALGDEAAAMEGMRAASMQLGLGLGDVAAELQAGSYAATTDAGAMAEAAIKANLLVEAEQQLAAANLTVVQTYQQMDAGLEVSAEAQQAALAGLKSAQSQVTALGGSLSGTADEASGVSGALGEVDKAATGAEHGMGGLASVMYGPLGMALYPLMMLLPTLGNLFSSSAVNAATFTSAVSQDSNAVGDNTAATIQSTLAKSNLADISKTLGLSQAQLIEYAAGEASVQKQAAAAYDATTSAMSKQAQGTAQGGPESGREAGYALTKLEQQKDYLDQVTASVQAAVQQDQAQSEALLAAEQSTGIYNASVNALGVSMQTQVEQTQMSNQATVQYGQSLISAESSTQFMNAAVGAAGVNLMLQSQATEVTNEATVQYGNAVMGAYRDATMFNSALDASYISMQEQAQTAAQSSVGLLNLGDSQSSVNRQLVLSEETYTQAQQGASAYGTALTALNGTTNTLLGSEAAFTVGLGGLTTAVQSNSTSLDVNNAKGAANIQVMTQIATQAQAAAVAVYQSDEANGKASQAYQDATTKLQQEKDAFEAAAEKAGFNKQQVEALANELYQLPPSIQTNVDVNYSQVAAAVSEVQTLMADLSGIGNAGSSASNANLLLHEKRAAGGPVTAGQTYLVGEQGMELFTPTQSGYITPHDALTAAAPSTAAGAPPGGPAYTGAGGGYSSGGGGGGSAPPVNVHVYVGGQEIAAVVRTDAQQYKQWNSQTGLT